MCGRFGLYLESGIFKRFNIEDDQFDVPLNFNIAPGMNAMVVTRNSPNKAEVMRWGLIPPWAKDIRIGFKMINARAETITQKPAYRQAFKARRCLIPFNCFYEWRQSEGGKTPFLFHDKENNYLSFAGLYEIAHDAEGKELKSFTIITTKANELMAGIHERMPVILTTQEEDLWLDKDTMQEDLLALLDGYKSKSFESYQIRDDVNKATNNSKTILEHA